MTNEKTAKWRMKIKVFLLVFLLMSLGAVAIAAWANDEYYQARQDTIDEIEESGSSIESEHEIEFNVNEPEDDSLNALNLLLVGVDSDGGVARTDTIMIARYLPDEADIKLASIMRDTYVEIPGHGKNKINAAYAFGGLDLLRETIELNFDFDIQHYAQVDFDSFKRVVDTVSPEGIDIEVENRMFYEDRVEGLVIDFQPGTHTMDGSEALKYVRFRSDSENDFGRVRRQQELLSILQDEILSLSGVAKVPSLLGSVEPYIQTNLSNGKMMSYGRDFFLNGPEDIGTLTIPVEGSFTHEYYTHAGAVLEPDLNENNDALSSFLDPDTDQVTIHDDED
ncbi:LCP family protein [Salisediminibacterium beveridgei]|uniref:Regulatory protein MsrR n=1 Tax=Salisediminibacterium beveridgei TaxID=632773 RepID=A0A1D7QWJ2_9BACI|nr:LCP family protein [Salisediminibacterium beveridgei]AOM83385.1 Cell envelope-associated transcriptional attenuator LytR-CpsA-Psr, subfamily F1 [Salisediminibacterium beveridgei]